MFFRLYGRWWATIILLNQAGHRGSSADQEVAVHLEGSRRYPTRRVVVESLGGKIAWVKGQMQKVRSSESATTGGAWRVPEARKSPSSKSGRKVLAE